MAENPQITDEQLLEQLKASAIADDQKSDLELLIPHMTAEERKQLTELIERSHAELDSATAEEYKKEIEAASEEFRHDFEAADQAAAAPQLQELEGKIADVKPAEKKPAAPEAKKPKKKGGALKYILMVIALILIAGGALLALNYLG